MRAIRVGLVSAVMLALVSTAWAGDDDALATGFAATTQELRDDGVHHTYYFPFDPAPGVDPATLGWRVIDVATETLHEPALIPAFLPSLDVKDGRHRLAVVVDFKAFIKPATYTVTVELVGPIPAAPAVAVDAGAPDADAGVRDAGAAAAPVATRPPRQTVVLTLDHPGATLRPPPTWIVWQTRTLLGGDRREPGAFPLGELSRRSRLSSMTVVQHEPAKLGEEPVSGRMVVTTPTEIRPGAIASVEIALIGDFPLGTTKGALGFRAPQLAEPVVVNYEVRTRAPGWYVIPIFLLAGLLGWLFRVYLKEREERLALEGQAEDALRRLDEAMTADPDSVLVLDPLRRALQAALDGTGDVKLGAATEAAAAGLATAATAHAEARTTLVTTSRADAELLDRPWALPPGIATAAARAHFGEAAQLALADRLPDARAACKAGGDAVGGLIQQAAAWGQRLDRALAALAQPAPAVPAALAAAWTASATAVRTALAALPDGNPGDTTALDAFLKALHAAQGVAVASVTDAAEALAATAREVGHALVAEGDPAAPAHADAVAAAARIDPAVLADVARGLGAIAPATRAVVQAVRAAIVALYAPQDPKPIDALLAAGDYLGAVTAAQEARGGRRDISHLEGVDAGGPTVVAPDRRPRAIAPAPARAAREAIGAASPAGQRRLAIRHARTLRSLASTRALRGAISIAIVTTGAYLLYGASFVGTFREVWGLVAVAFTAEFTVEAALESLGKAEPADG